ncbi:hypothetical protein PENANT_c011G04009 [Penicillium antarcticum]|uniref:1,3-beta-glucanosyltransferase n=1 Tax=Penicillium antarcticum TaxID=416450 RepID=A0A1V6Q733_9EURO|nr:uncharacterized protein N7508_003025 [Penicillium antarcticum]KAJ5312195.1 hypothetical protein N7508_003025 [Penicillium antarcticum]OQD85038.1 hypothetical protein PENANT_c011G04009 [Penicillium antarcticum]
MASKGVRRIRPVGNGFTLSNGTTGESSRFQIKGVAYIWDTNTAGYTDLLADEEQCAIDAPLMKELGVNVISVYAVDATKNHDKCMQTFYDNGIYVIANLEGTWAMGNNTWDMYYFEQYSAVLDALAGYDNTLGLIVSNQNIATDSQIDNASSLKAAVRDMKAYANARGYRNLPIGYYTTMLTSTNWLKLGEYLACGNSSNAIDFLGLDLYTWCGSSSIESSGYDDYLKQSADLGIPIFLSEDGCSSTTPRTFGDQAAVFGSVESTYWSGAIIYGWREEVLSPGRGLVSYPNVTGASSAAATPTLLADYTNLQNQWASVTTSSHTIRVTTAPACPTSSTSLWTLNPLASLPTISGLDFATVKEASLTRLSTSPSAGASDRTSTGSASFPSSSGTLSDSDPMSGTSGDSDAKLRIGVGVGVGVGVGLLLMAAALFFWCRRRKPKNTKSNPEGFQNEQKHPRELEGEWTAPEMSGSPSAAVNPKEIFSTEILEASAAKNHTQGDLNAVELDTASATLGRGSSSSPVPVPVPPIVSNPVFETEAVRSTLGNSGLDELAEEADIAVQELGFINLRKRALAVQAEALKRSPESMAGRKGEEYRELLQREEKITARLEDIESQQRRSDLVA